MAVTLPRRSFKPLLDVEPAYAASIGRRRVSPTVLGLLAIAVVYGGLLIAVLWRPLLEAHFEDDLLWYVPTIAQGIEGRDPLQALAFLVDPTHREYGVASLNLYTAAILLVFGPQAKYFIALGLVIHAACAVLVYRLARRLGLGLGASLAAALLFLVALPQFGAYMWPMAAQHAFVVLAALLVIERYLATQQRIDRGLGYGHVYALTVSAAGLASFLRPSVLLIPLAIGIHLVVRSARSDADRAAGFRRWVPLLLAFLGYPLFVLSVGGEPVLQRRLPLWVAGSDPLRTYALLLGLGLATIAFVWVGLACWPRLSARPRLPAQLRPSIPAIALLGLFVALGSLTGRDPISAALIALLPLEAFLVATLQPLGVAQTTDNVNRWNYLPVAGPLDLAGLGLALLFAVAAGWLLRRNRHAVLLIAWYLAAQAYLSSADFVFKSDALLLARWPVEYPSRYFVYVAPPVCIAASAITVLLYRRVAAGFGWGRGVGKLALGVFGLLLVANVLAIGFAVFRDRLVNNLLAYDSIRLATLMHDYLVREGDPHPGPEQLSVRGVPLTPFAAVWHRVVTPADPERHDAFRYLVAQAFDDPSLVDLSVNPTDGPDAARWRFAIVGRSVVVDGSGATIDPFARDMANGLAALRAGNDADAQRAFSSAVTDRPFILRYVLGDRADSDVRYVTNGIGMRAWLDQLAANHVDGASFGTPAGDQRISEITQSMRGEIDDYVRCLFYLAFLSRDDPDQSAEWAAGIHLFTQAYEDLSASMLNPPDAPALIDNQLETFLRSDRFHGVAFPFGRDYVRKFPHGRDQVGVSPGDWPVHLLLSWPQPRATPTRHRLQPGQYALRDGFFSTDADRAAVPRWTGGRGVVEFVPRHTGPIAVRIRMVQPDFGIRRTLPEVQLALDGVPVPTGAWSLRQDPPGHFELELSLDPSEQLGRPRRLELAAAVFVPQQCEPGNADQRRLGVLVEAVHLEENGTPLEFVDLPVYPSLPLSIDPVVPVPESSTQRSCPSQIGGFRT